MMASGIGTVLHRCVEEFPLCFNLKSREGDSYESWERFRDGILMPRMQQGIKGGFTTTPQETSFDVHNLQP